MVSSSVCWYSISLCRFTALSSSSARQRSFLDRVGGLRWLPFSGNYQKWNCMHVAFSGLMDWFEELRYSTWTVQELTSLSFWEIWGTVAEVLSPLLSVRIARVVLMRVQWIVLTHTIRDVWHTKRWAFSNILYFILGREVAMNVMTSEWYHKKLIYMLMSIYI